MKVLVVEDDFNIAKSIEQLLLQNHYAVDVAADAETGLQMVTACHYDLALLEIALPDMDGLSLCQRLRQQGLQIPVLVLSGRGGNSPEKAAAIKVGADGWVAKPFAAEELVARVQALLPRHQTGLQSPGWDGLARPVATPATNPPIAELALANEQLRRTLEELQTASEELRTQNEELQATRHALEQERHRYQDLFENAPNGYLVTDRHGTIEAANRAAATLLAVSSESLEGQRLADFINEADRPTIENCLFRPSWPQNWEIRLQPQQQLPLPVLMAVTPLLDDQQQVTKLRWSLRDIRDRKRMEQRLQASHDELRRQVAEQTAELREREAFLSSIYDGAEQAIFVIDVTAEGDFRYASFNRAAQQLAGLRQAAIQNRSPEAVYGRVIGGEFRRQYQLCVEAAHSIAYEEHFELNGRPLWVITTLSPIKNRIGQVYRLVGTVLDISDRKQAELQLKEISTALSHAVEGISRLDVNGHYTFVNEAYARLVGYTPDEMVGQSWDITVYQEDWSPVEAAFQTMLSQGKAELETRGIRKDGSIFYKQLTLIACYDSQQQFSGHYCFVKDVSDRKQAEAMLQQQIRQEYLLADIAQDIRRSLNLEEVLSRTVHRIRDFLETDRVIIFRFRPDWQGDVIMESVGSEWVSILSTTIYDPCFKEQYIEPYRQGHVAAVTDIDGEDLDPCYVELLKSFQVKANLVVPILQGEALWGLLIAHHCAAPREWQLGEIAVLRRLAIQVGIASQQSELYEQTRRELSARQQMQMVLEESEERFRTLSKAAPVGILQTNADGIGLYTNDHWQKMSGLSFEESLGAGWQQVIHPEDRDRVRQIWEEHLRYYQERRTEFRLLTPQAEVRWVTARVAAIQSAADTIIGHVCIFADITEQKQAAQKIEEQAALLDIAPDAIFVRDLDHQILYWNHGAEHLYGWTAAEALGQKATELLQEEPAQVAKILATLFDRGEWRGEMAKLTQQGERGIIEGRWTLVRDEAGQPKYVLTVNTDITEKKNLEAQFYQAQKLESLGQLASGIAHDLNNVFTPILTVSQVLRLRQKNLDEKSLQLLQLLENSAKRGANMVQQVLTVTRGGAGEREILNPIEVLEEVVKIVQESFPQAIAIQSDLAAFETPDHEPIQISIDPTQLHQILMNLLVNARDAMPGGGTLTLSAQKMVVDAVFAQQTLDAHEGEYIVITVTDTGTGIPPEVRDRMFDPFFTTKEPGKGTGLGLPTVLSLVKNSDGFLQVLSTVGQGTTIKIYLPTIDTPPTVTLTPEQVSAQPAIAPTPGQGELILVVDDDETVQQATQSLLEGHHYTTLVANDGPQAIALYAQHQTHIRLVILDITMPQMSGIDLIKRLRAFDSTVRIIAISGLPANQAPALAAGANTFLSKPYPLDKLLAEVNILMS